VCQHRVSRSFSHSKASVWLLLLILSLLTQEDCLVNLKANAPCFSVTSCFHVVGLKALRPFQVQGDISCFLLLQ